MRFRLTIFLACMVLFPRIARPTDFAKNRKAAAAQVSSQISRIGVHSLYVPDFLDASGQRTYPGAFLAGAFAKLLDEHSKGFTLVPRAYAHKFLDQSGWTDKDLSTPDVLAQFNSKFSPDTILLGVIASDNSTYSIDLVARDLSGKELFRFSYQDPGTLYFEGYFPPGTGPSGRIYYFPGLDGVSFPKCVSCPSPHYSEPARTHKVHGVVILSALIGLDAKPDQIRIIKKLAPELDRNALDVMKDWSVQPPHDPDGSPVPARILFEINFKLSVPKNLAFLIPEILARPAIAGRARTLPVPPVGRPGGRRRRMLGMLKRHEVEILLKAGHSKAEVARLAGVSLRSVNRIAEEAPVVHVDDAAEREKRQIGRPSIVEDFRKPVVKILEEKPDLPSREILRRARGQAPGNRSRRGILRNHA